MKFENADSNVTEQIRQAAEAVAEGYTYAYNKDESTEDSLVYYTKEMPEIKGQGSTREEAVADAKQKTVDAVTEILQSKKVPPEASGQNEDEAPRSYTVSSEQTNQPEDKKAA